MEYNTEFEMNNVVMISLSDLLAYIIRKWKTLLLIMLVGAALIGGLLSWQESKEIEGRYSDMSLRSIKSVLSENQITNVDQLYQRYVAYKEQIGLNENYMKHSFLIQMDPTAASIYTAEYLVHSDQEGVINSFVRLALGNDDYIKIAAILGDEIDEKFVYEVVSMGGINTNESQQLDVDGKDDVYVGSISNEYKGIMVVNITASNKAQCDEIAAIVDAAIQAHLDRLVKSGVEVVVIPVGTNYIERLSEVLVAKRQEKIDESMTTITGYNTFLKNNIDTLSTDEKRLFDFYRGRFDAKEEHVHWKKYVVIGAALGLFLGLVLYALIYLLADVIHITEELEKKYRLKKLGIIFPADNKRGLNKALSYLADQIAYDRKHDEPNNSLDVVKMRLQKYLTQNDIGNVYLAINDFDEEAAKLGQMVEQYLSEHGLKTGLGNPRGSAEELEHFCQADATVFIGTLNKIRRTNIQAVNDIGIENSSPLIGFLAVADV